ncbi:hypothetical protein TRFO_30561 [Tritrichomonas foetus]|uniref:Initiator binding domain-containing protein n=1 Tax=Tritrichomonas foetus TaxID=1144522 RepID=A0A1J4JTC5_9EUKA|nr:hypothetical protein TRFO_30561 [Tritrichomonas foetus]|eukprot:OHT02367.1 hypothetical protein TRFO_30561 [Tritrichomonas foetus]
MTTAQLGHSPPLTFWEQLSVEDKNEYHHLRESFHQQHIAHTKTRSNSSTFQSDLRSILNFIERRAEQQEARSIVCGVSLGNNFVCVNTRQLKYLIGKCKSSINNGFQQLGYISAKNKVKQCLISVLPNLVHDSTLLRQWTVRCAEPNAVPLRKILLTTQQRPMLPTPQINMNIHREALPVPLFDTSPKDKLLAPVTPVIMPPPRPLSTPILTGSTFSTISLFDDDNDGNEDVFDVPIFPREDFIFGEEKDSPANFEDNDWSCFKGFLATDGP